METVGELLRAEREKKGLSIKDIETAISIRALYIKAIEDGDYTVVPGEVYLKGFIRNYANYLGLNGPEMVASYRQSQQPIVPETVEIPVEPTPPQAPQAKPRSKTNSGKNSGKLLIISLLVVCVAGSAWWLLGNQSPKKEPIETKQTQPPAQTTPQPVAPVVPTQSKPVVVIAKYTEACWTSVVADDKQIYEGTPKNGDTITWEAQKNITITAGNAGGIEITHNGQALGKIGNKGEVLVKTYVAKQ